VVLLRDVVIFVIGLGIVLGQTGFPYLIDAPAKLSIPALITGALFCNGPVVLQALAIRFGTGSPGSQSASSSPPSSPESSVAPSSGVE
jgi:hypothetical protein